MVKNKIGWYRVMLLLASVTTVVIGCDSGPVTKTVDNGLLIQELQSGQGDEAVSNAVVNVHYTGWVYDDTATDNKGKKFDSSLDRQKPFSFVTGQNRVIKGWEQGVLGMKVGEKRRLTIPPELAYGERGFSNVIPPNSMLVFDIELLGVDPLEIIDKRYGEGVEAINGSKVSVHYTGWLYDENALQNKGKKFDSSLDRGHQFSFVLGAQNVITGWDLGVAGMKVGGKRTLVIPAELAYGAQARGENIPANSKLVFDIELFEVDTGVLQ